MINENNNNYRTLLKLPTIESQLLFWFELIDHGLIEGNIWLERAGFKVYVRKTKRNIENKDLIMLDIANIEIPKKFRNRGWFKKFRIIAERLNPWDGVYYDSVKNYRLKEYFEKENIQKEYENNFYVLKNKSNQGYNYV